MPRQFAGGQVLQPGGLGQNGPMQPQIPMQWLWPGLQLCRHGFPQFFLHNGPGEPGLTETVGGNGRGGGGGGGPGGGVG